MTEESKNKDEEQESKGSQKNVFEELGDSVGKFASKTMESIKKSIDKALDSRNTVLTIRVNDEANHKMNMLVESGIFKSRSESAAFLIEEGIKKQEALYQKISEKMDQINKLKDELKTIMSEPGDDTGKKKKT